MSNSMDNLASVSKKLRYTLVEISNKKKIPHLASCLSCLDIILVLYSSILRNSRQNGRIPGNDKFILSKGHAANSLYAVLAEYGYFDKGLLYSIGEKDSILEEHPYINPDIGIEISSGALGHGLPIGAGMALSSKILNNDNKVYVLAGDGECNEGTIWEAAMFAAAHKLHNLHIIIDYNKWQATDRSDEVMALQPLKAKFEAFGWDAVEINGHDHNEIYKALTSHEGDKPLAVIAHTVKGKGISFMEDDNNWHYRIPGEDDMIKAKNELT